jgi:cardiolipin synthase A/B
MIAASRHLSPEESKAIIARLQQKVGPTDILNRHVTVMTEIVGPLVVGNKARLLVDGPQTYAAMFQAVRNARDSINVQTYIFEDDEVGQRFADLFIQKRREGVRINIIYDSQGSKNTPSSFFERLQAAGIKTVEFNPFNPLEAGPRWSLTHRDHRKLLTVDGKTAFTGGVNISAVYSKSSSAKRSGGKGDRTWRDTHIQIEGPVVKQLQSLFIDTWKQQSGASPDPADYFPSLKREGPELMQVVASSPGEEGRLAYLMYMSAIMFATKYIYLTSSYFVPDDQLVNALKEAVGRGVDVKLILPSDTDIKSILHAGRSFYTELLEAGVKIFERRGSILHAKTGLVDGVWATVGSTNLDFWSLLRNDEINVVVVGTDFSAQMESLFRKDLEESEQIHLNKWRQRPLLDRFKEWFYRRFRWWL